MTDEEARRQKEMLVDMAAGKKVELSTEDDVTGRVIFGDEWPKVKAGMEPGVYELAFEALPPPAERS